MKNFEHLSELGQLVDSLADSPFILAEKRIAPVLRKIVMTDELAAVAKKCLTDFNYEVEFVRARIDSDSGRASFALPKEREKIVALTFCLLAEFDAKKRDLQQFIEEYFYADGDCFSGYEAFVREVLRPFFDSFSSLCKEEETEYFSEGELKIEEIAYGKDFAAVGKSSAVSIFSCTYEIMRVIETDFHFQPAAKQDLFFVIRTFHYAVKEKDRVLMKSLFFGLRGMLAGSRPYAKQIAELERILAELWVL